MFRVTLTLESGAVVTLISREIVAFSAGRTDALEAVLAIRSPTGELEIYDLGRVDLEEQFRQAAEGLPRRV